MADENEESKKQWEKVGLFIPAGVLLGLGIGMAVGQVAPGLFIGLGAGFLAMALARLIRG